ncbi:MAG: YihY/virulence factor BrkB family protein [Bacteroidia bacterium]|nr:YihY/virulence factor BrkB family protein [Bacteroidia bacterium]
MANFVAFIKRSSRFLKHELWKVRLNKVEKRQGILIRQLRVFSLAIKEFRNDNSLITATALTFYSIFSIVPILALIFAIAKGFGYEKTLQEQILNNYGEYADILNNAFIYANSMLANTKGGIIAGFGIVLLLWSVMQLLINIEDSFNRIWEVTHGRSWVRKVTDYLTIMLIGPLLLILSGGLTVALQTKVGGIESLSLISAYVMKLFAYLLVSGVFTFLYVVIPNTKVNIKAAFTAGLITACLFELLGWAYIRFQIGANRMNAIYGGFAALPLFFIWLQYSWYVILFGAQLAYANEYVEHYELEDDIKNISTRYRKVIGLMIANLVAKGFYDGQKSLTIKEITDKLDIPPRLARLILYDFVTTGVFVEVLSDNDEIVYQPGITESKFTVKYLIDTMEKKGVNDLAISNTNELTHIHRLMEELDKTMDTDTGHLHIKDIVK